MAAPIPPKPAPTITTSKCCTLDDRRRTIGRPYREPTRTPGQHYLVVWPRAEAVGGCELHLCRLAMFGQSTATAAAKWKTLCSAGCIVTGRSALNKARGNMEGFAGKVAVVTGAGSGIGQALAMELARSGAKLAISDIDSEGLACSEERLRYTGASVKADRLDVTDRERFLAYADEVRDHFGVVNQIYNNAGIAFTGNVEMSQFNDMEHVMNVN